MVLAESAEWRASTPVADAPLPTKIAHVQRLLTIIAPSTSPPDQADAGGEEPPDAIPLAAVSEAVEGLKTMLTVMPTGDRGQGFEEVAAAVMDRVLPTVERALVRGRQARLRAASGAASGRRLTTTTRTNVTNTDEIALALTSAVDAVGHSVLSSMALGAAPREITMGTNMQLGLRRDTFDQHLASEAQLGYAPSTPTLVQTCQELTHLVTRHRACLQPRLPFVSPGLLL